MEDAAGRDASKQHVRTPTNLTESRTIDNPAKEATRRGRSFVRPLPPRTPTTDNTGVYFCSSDDKFVLILFYIPSQQQSQVHFSVMTVGSVLVTGYVCG